MNLTGKVTLVTGASRGIGRQIALTLAGYGATVIVNYNGSAAKAEEVVNEITANGGMAESMQCSISDFEKSKEMIDGIVKKYGRLDILVNNAGIVDKHRPITECTDEWWNESIAIDQSSLFYMMKDTIPHMMAAGKGSIINVSSIGGVFGNGGISYSAAKSAALAMTKNVAIQLAPNGIRCNAVCPGPTPTPLNTPEKVAEFSTWFAERCAQHMDMSLPESSVEDQANAILFFAEDASAAVTGQYLIVDHGTTL